MAPTKLAATRVRRVLPRLSKEQSGTHCEFRHKETRMHRGERRTTNEGVWRKEFERKYIYIVTCKMSQRTKPPQRKQQWGSEQLKLAGAPLVHQGLPSLLRSGRQGKFKELA